MQKGREGSLYSSRACDSYLIFARAYLQR